MWNGPRSVFFLAASCVAIAGCSKGSNSENSPTGPSNTSKIQGGWTGTIARSGGQSLALRWDVTVNTGGSADELQGTMTITGPSASTAAVARGVPSGNDKQGYNIYVSFSDTTPQSPCSVKGNPAASTGDPYPSPYTTISVPAFTLFVAGDCRGVFDGGTQQTNLQESVRLSLTKQ